MAYMGQPVPSTVTSISQIKVSDGKSVEVTVPAGSGTVAGNFYVLDGFLASFSRQSRLRTTRQAKRSRSSLRRAST